MFHRKISSISHVDMFDVFSTYDSRLKVLNRFSTDSKSRIGMKFYSLGENSFLTIEFLRFPL